jgi:PPOX class probable FMN-dependent enzyme
MARIESLDALEALYRQPSERVRTKKRGQLDDGLRAVLAASPFVLLATSDGDGGCDVSPRGGPAGFVKALDDRHVAVPDLNGNNLVDSLRNIVTNPHAALLVLVPGEHETMRIDGAAHLSTDDAVLERFTEELRRPTLAVVIEIEHVFTHCAKAFLRGKVWEPTAWRAFDPPVVLGARYRQLGLDVSFAEYSADNTCTIERGLAEDAPCP